MPPAPQAITTPVSRAVQLVCDPSRTGVWQTMQHAALAVSTPQPLRLAEAAKQRCHTNWSGNSGESSYIRATFASVTCRRLLSNTGDIRFDHLKFVIADYSRITSCVANPSEIEAVWVLDYGAKRSNLDVRKAVVTTNARVIDLADFYVERLGGAFPVRIFPTQVEARRWLGP